MGSFERTSGWRARLACLFLLLVAAAGTAGTDDVFDQLQSPMRTQVMVLGMFHFDDAGLDDYRPRHRFDPLSERGRREVEQLLGALECFAPTHVALEVRRDRQEVLDQRFARFARGELDQSRNEIDRVGLALATRLGHARVFAVDAPAPDLHPTLTRETFERMVKGWGQSALMSDKWASVYTLLYRQDDERKMRENLMAHLRYINSADRLRVGHGAYLVGPLRVGRDRYEYLGADLVEQWYGRNLRIFANIARVTRNPADRVLLVIGAGHVPVIRHALEASPEYVYVPPAAYLEGTVACRASP